tara:strand:+ start:5138 stop:5803 length:666 start_codon:yes stop_codon:yes gene_type:complete
MKEKSEHDWISKTRLDALKKGLIPRQILLRQHIVGTGSQNVYHHKGNTVRKRDMEKKEKNAYKDIKNYVKDDERKKHLLEYIADDIDDPDYPNSIILENLSRQGFKTFDKFPLIVRDDQEDELRKLCKEVKRVILEFLKNGIIHHDGKPENIMIKKNKGVWQVKIIDLETVEFSANVSDGKIKSEYEQYMDDFLFDADYEENNFVYLRENINILREELEKY